MLQFLRLASIFTTTFLAPLAQANQPITLPLPQDINYDEYAATQIFNSNFSTDPLQLARVLAARRVEGEREKGVTQAGSGVVVFIINREACAELGDAWTYRIVVRNFSQDPVTNVLVQNQYPEGTKYQEKGSTPPPQHSQASRMLVWDPFDLGPGQLASFEFTVTTPEPRLASPFTTLDIVDVAYSGPQGIGRVITSHSIPSCQKVGQQQTEPLPSKQPVIICDPSEQTCTPSIPQLGPNFEKAQDPRQQPRICSNQSYRGAGLCVPYLPDLGVRFSEAVANILPGECKVLEDEVISSPQFQDGYNRLFDPAAPFMIPLYQSSLDFKKLMHENVLLGITQKSTAKDALGKIHSKYWQGLAIALQEVLNGTRTTDYIRSNIPRWEQQFINEIKSEQARLQKSYAAMQEQRRAKFDPIATKAVGNAKESIINRACGGDDPEFFTLFSQSLQFVKQAYEQNLTQQEADYQTMQELFADPNSSIFPPPIHARTWQQELKNALTAFDQGNRKPLQDFHASIPSRERRAFEKAFAATYEAEFQANEVSDGQVRLQHWEPALDIPKIYATDCQKSNSVSASVETTWCESGYYPEFLGERAAQESQENERARPPDTSILNFPTSIDPTLVRGASCRGNPGDPWWTPDCGCSCSDKVPTPEGVILPCEPPHPIIVYDPASLGKPLRRHDINITSQEECLQEDVLQPTQLVPKHLDEFF